MALVDYAGSESDSDDEAPTTQNTVAPKKTDSAESRPKTLVDNGFFDEEDAFDTGASSSNFNKEDVLEEIVKSRDWEKKLAQKQQEKLLKKARKAEKLKKKEIKKAKKEEKHRKAESGIAKSKPKKGKVVISAFGALGSMANDNDSDSDGEAKTVVTKPKVGLGLLASLPPPKGKDNKTDDKVISKTTFIPPSVAAKKPVQPNPTPVVSSAPKYVDSDDDDDFDGNTDFFGFSSAPKKVEYVPEIPAMASSAHMEVVGPSRPSAEQMHPSQMYNMADAEMESTEEPALKRGHITDEQAHKLLLRFSHDIGPEEKRSIDEMASSIVNVNVDDALGPNVRQNVLKNLSHRAFAEATSAPLPQVQHQGQTSRRKHQITYLANLAVSREEQLKDQWADQKQSKRMARQKYGF